MSFPRPRPGLLPVGTHHLAGGVRVGVGKAPLPPNPGLRDRARLIALRSHHTRTHAGRTAVTGTSRAFCSAARLSLQLSTSRQGEGGGGEDCPHLSERGEEPRGTSSSALPSALAFRPPGRRPGGRFCALSRRSGGAESRFNLDYGARSDGSYSVQGLRTRVIALSFRTERSELKPSSGSLGTACATGMGDGSWNRGRCTGWHTCLHPPEKNAEKA